MAKTALARRQAPVRRGPSPKLAKLEARIKAAGASARRAATRQETTVLTLGGAAAFALMQKKATLPTVAGLDPALLYGAAAVALGMSMKGKNGERLRSVGDGVLAVGIARAVDRGSVRGADDEYEDDDD